jgi:small subunit ribosomal protein S9
MAVKKKEGEELKPKRSRKEKFVVVRGKRKEAIARARIKEGRGVVRINGFLLNAFSSPIEREIISEPLSFLNENRCDIDVTVSGGGRMGQAQAARTAIARALVAFTKDDPLKQKMLEYDRTLLVEDARRVEPKKFKGPKARARFTKSYR